jgi:hypothetical protein
VQGAAQLFVRVTERLRRSFPRAGQYWSGFWLGALSRNAMAAVDEALYSLRSNYQTAEHNRQGLAPWERAAIEAYFSPGSRLMVLAVGGGREVVALRRLGFDAQGWESHPELLASAQKLLVEEGHAGVIHPVRRDEVPVGSDIYDGIILGWGMYMLVHGRPRRLALLGAAHRRLVAGGPLLLSFFDRVSDDRRALRVFRIAQLVRRILFREPVELGDDMLPNVVHRFTRDEIEQELKAAGFELLRFEPSGSGRLASAWAVARRA